MNMTWIILTASLFAEPAQGPEIPTCGVELRLRAKASVEESHQQLNPWNAFEMELVNTGDRAVTLVMPGDGSGVAWRTPVLRWSVSPEPEPTLLARCGNINSLRPGEVFTLSPGERRRLREWVPVIHGVKSGAYTLRLSYINDPTLTWQGMPLGPHDSPTMQRVRESTPCRAMSNEVHVTVVPRHAP